MLLCAAGHENKRSILSVRLALCHAQLAWVLSRTLPQAPSSAASVSGLVRGNFLGIRNLLPVRLSYQPPPPHSAGHNLPFIPELYWSGWFQSSCQPERSFLRSCSWHFPLTFLVVLNATISMFPSLIAPVPYLTSSHLCLISPHCFTPHIPVPWLETSPRGPVSLSFEDCFPV